MGSPAVIASRDDFAVRYIDAQGDLPAGRIARICQQFADVGAVHITNTNLADAAQLLPLLKPFGFGAHEQFTAGGRTASAWQEKWAAPDLRRLDYYPPHLYLLPNGEIHYQHEFPARVLFFCATPPVKGGRTFLHASKKVERALPPSLLDKIAAQGLMIEVGFLDKNHPQKQGNYYQSWQERFGTEARDAALATAQAATDEYDLCWWEKHDGFDTLMTRITLPGYVADKRDGESYLRFPRIAMDGPALHNGFRRYPLGNGEEFSELEKSLLRDAYDSTRDGFMWKQGDVILMDNIRFGHSREPFVGDREVLLSMAGLERV